MIVWAEFPESAVKVTKGIPRTINSSGAAMRSFCPDCGSGLFYRNAEILPGVVEVQASTLENPAELPPTFQIQTAEQQPWVPHLGEIRSYERFP